MNLNATLIGQSLTFLVFVMFCMKYIWPPIRQAMQDRQEAIAAGLRASEEADEMIKAGAQRGLFIYKMTNQIQLSTLKIGIFRQIVPHVL